jgi:hypothetical protein
MAKMPRELLEKEKRRLESEAAALRAELRRISKLKGNALMMGRSFDKKAPTVPKWADELGEVAHRFSQDPAACLKDRNARRVLRTYEHPYRYWYKLLPKNNREKVVNLHLQRHPHSRKEKVRLLLDQDQFKNVEKPLVERQQIPYWNDLREQLLHIHLPPRLENRFADLLTGYLLVLELQPEQHGKLWRAFKRSRKLKEVGVTPSMTITAMPPHREHLQTRLLVLMMEDLARRGWSEKRAIYLRFIIPAWELIGIKIRDDESLLRQVRRSHHKDRLPR